MSEKVLGKIGFRKKWSYETVVTTSDGKRNNAAPMGVWTNDFSTIDVEMYKNSKTLKNILETDEFVVNFVEDTEIFYETLYAKDKLRYKKAKKVCAPVLSEANMWLELRVKTKKENDRTTKICADIISFKVDKKPFLLNRANCLALESLIKATKVPFKKKDIIENLRVIKKVAPDSEYEKIVEKILKK